MSKKKRPSVKNAASPVPDPGYLESLGSSAPPSQVPSSGARTEVRLSASLLNRAREHAAVVGIPLNSLLCVALSEYLRDRLT